MRFSLLQERSALFNYQRSAPIAQLVEQLICNQWVGSSSLSGGTIVFKGLVEIRWDFCRFDTPLILLLGCIPNENVWFSI